MGNSYTAGVWCMIAPWNFFSATKHGIQVFLFAGPLETRCAQTVKRACEILTAMQSYTQKVPKSQSYIRHQRRIRSFCPCTQGIGVGASAAPCTQPVGGIKEGGSARFLWGRPLPSGCSGSYKCLNSSVTLVGCAWMIRLLHCFGATHFRGATAEVISA